MADTATPPEGLDDFLNGSESAPINSTAAPTPEGLDAFIAPEMEQAKYETPGQMAITAAEGAAKGLAGPLATAAEIGLGVNPEDMRKRAEINPATHAISEAAGFIAPAILSRGATAKARLSLEGAAALSQAAGLTKLGAKAAELMGLGGEGAGTMSKIAAQALKDGIGMGGMQLGDEASKMIMQDPDQTVQSAAANVGLAGLIGAGGGAALGSMGELWKASKPAAKVEALANDFKGRINEHLGIAPDERFNPFTKDVEPKPKAVPELEDLKADTAGSKMADILMKMVMKHAGGGAVGAALGHMTGIPGMGLVGGVLGDKALSPLFNSVLPALAKRIIGQEANGAGMQAAVNMGLAAAKGQELLSKAATNVFKPGAMVVAENLIPDDKSRSKLNKTLAELQVDPSPLTNVASDTQHYLPEHAASLAQTSANAVNYLNSLRADNDPKAPMDTKIPPSSEQKAKFNNALDIAEQPLLVMHQIKKGNITPQSIQHLNALYPALYGSMKQQLLSAATSHMSKGQIIPYRTRIGMSMFLAQPMDSTLTPQGIMSAQPIPPQVPQQQVKGTGTAKHSMTGLSKLPKSYQTQGQAAEAGRSSRH